jgi:hypothetical protein
VDLDLVKNAGVRAARVSDGPGNTGAFSETQRGANGPRRGRLRTTNARTDRVYVRSLPDSSDVQLTDETRETVFR